MPLRVNMAGVIPVIFAAALMALPPTAAQFVPAWTGFVNRNFQSTSLLYLGIEALLIIVFTYFYTSVQFNPVDQADNLRKYGGYIPNIATADMIREMMQRPTELGAELREVYDRGDLVSDDLMIRLTRDRLDRGDTLPGFVLDGFPRTLVQAEALDDLMSELGRPIDVVF